jgi:sugar-specific transcriptional regulator TrmB
MMSELGELYRQGLDLVDPTDMTGSIKGRENIYNHLTSMIKNAERSITISTTPGCFIENISKLKPHLKKASKNGVSIRLSFPLEAEAKKIAQEFSKIAKVTESKIRARACVVDGREILFMLSDDKDVHPSYDVGVWVHTPFLGSLLDKALSS